MRQDLLKEFTQEQIARARSCKNQEELFTLAKNEGVELSDEQLAAITGGACSSTEETDKKDTHRKIES